MADARVAGTHGAPVITLIALARPACFRSLKTLQNYGALGGPASRSSRAK